MKPYRQYRVPSPIVTKYDFYNNKKILSDNKLILNINKELILKRNLKYFNFILYSWSSVLNIIYIIV